MSRTGDRRRGPLVRWRDRLRRLRGDHVTRRAAERAAQRAADRVVAEIGERLDALATTERVPGDAVVPAAGSPGSTIAEEAREASLEELVSVWSASEEDEIVRAHSHWRGAGGSDDDVWLAIGRRTRAYVEALLDEVGGPTPARSALDVLEWGPGGGSNLVALAPLCRRYVGVDISAPNLAECGRQAAAADLAGFEPTLLAGAPATVAEQVAGDVDVLVCTSVFQHFPSVAYGEEVLAAMRAVSHERTVGVIQVRYAERSHRRPATGRYRDDYIHGAIHPLPDFWWSLDRAGFTPLRIVDLDEATRYAWFLFRATP